MGVGARVWVRTKFMHPKKVIATMYDEVHDEHKLEDLVVLRQELKKIGKKDTLAIVMTHPDFTKKGIPIELYCNEKHCHVTQGADHGFDQSSEDPDGVTSVDLSDRSSKAIDIESGTKTTSRQVSMLDAGDDPFAPREGKSLVWKDINMILVSSLRMSKD